MRYIASAKEAIYGMFPASSLTRVIAMDGGSGDKSAARFAAYVDVLSKSLGHADRRAPMRDYCLGLMMPIERKSVEPMAAVTAPCAVAAKHQSLLHFVGNAPWSDEAMLANVRDTVLPAIERRGPIEAWIIDDTGFPKKGRHSVGVSRQYCGQIGKQDNCQVAVSLSLANRSASLPVAYRLYLPHEWADDQARRDAAKVPDDVVFKTKNEIAGEQIEAACAAGLPRGVVLMDAAYGDDTQLRTKITDLGLVYGAGIRPNTTVWAPGTAPLLPEPYGGRGQPPKRLRRDPEHLPVAVKALALGLPRKAWRTVRWREGSAEWLSSRFARLRVRPAHRDHERTEMRPEEWLLIDWPRGEAEPTRYWLSTMPPETSFRDLVDITKLRWRIERDYQELKQEVGLGHYEGRSWRGFHHHATLCIAAYGFLIAERAAIPPSASRCATVIPQSPVPADRHRRGAASPA
jgi:SRSO17 transposase